MELFDIIEVAYRARLLFRSERGYREVSGVSFETIADHREDEGALRLYYDLFNGECIRQSGESLKELAGRYLDASLAFNGKEFEWYERRQLASRKKFLRWIFRKVAAPGSHLSAKEEFRFRPKDCDNRLLETIFPEGLEEGARIDLAFLLLIAFGVVKPFPISRSRDAGMEELHRQLTAMIKLVTILYADIPQIGTLPKPIIFDITLEQLHRKIENIDNPTERAECSVAWFWSLLKIIEDSCISVSSPQRLADTKIITTGYSMPGIWVDDYDEGKTRFWIFPENKLMAFCYHYTDGCWHLRPYEFCFYSLKDDDEIGEICVFATAKGNLQLINSSDGIMNPDELVTAKYELGKEDEIGLFSEISFAITTPQCPEWFRWKSFRRLSSADSQFIAFREVLKDIYYGCSTLSFLFKNEAPFLTDSVNALFAMDNDYLYLYDGRPEKRFVLQQDSDVGLWFDYLPEKSNGKDSVNLLNVKVSEEHPLYIIPRFTNLERPMSSLQRRFAEAALNTELHHQISIYRTAQRPAGILCFNTYSLIIPLDADLSKFGIRKITSRKELFGVRECPAR
ncbi:MAG: hypothetical protein K2J82_00280 [Muribaculaceae bacterium]|nr:hypothetical protein [Muribaculaceae bacterium]